MFHLMHQSYTACYCKPPIFKFGGCSNEAIENHLGIAEKKAEHNNAYYFYLEHLRISPGKKMMQSLPKRK
jgi:hypothetical protein